jgi:hypothetical protein
MVWDFMETNPFNEVGANWISGINACQDTISLLKDITYMGQVEKCSATMNPLPDDITSCVITDPPYYNAVPYADLSDFFFVWLKRTIGSKYPDLFSSEMSPKENEICEMAGWDSNRYSHKDGQWFEAQMKIAMTENRRILSPDGICVVVFAHKSTQGWEAQLQSMIEAGWIFTGSWPIDTERPGRLRAQGSAALASSIHLICRPRENEDGSIRNDIVGDWRDVLHELPIRIHEWMPRLALEGVVGADAIFACIGPALEIFSRYSRVEKASGEQVQLREYLEQVWAAVAREALNLIFDGADTIGFEEDARLTAMWLWTLSTGVDNEDNTDDDDNNYKETNNKKIKSSGGFILEYDAARKIAQGLGAHLEQLNHLVMLTGETACLLPVSARTHYLFGKEEATIPAGKKRKEIPEQMSFDSIEAELKETEGDWGEKSVPKIGNTTLDQIHQSMILFAAGRSDALKRFLVEEGVGQDIRFWRLAQALSALYPAQCDEKRWVDGVLARKKGLGF